MLNKATNLIWLDLEMTGLDPEQERIIEICAVVTDQHFNIIAQGPNLVIKQAPELLATMDAWNTKQHGQSGLVQEVLHSTITEAAAEAMILEFLLLYTNFQTSPLCGNSVWQDRRFLLKYMPKLAKHLHYRHLDVSTLKILAQIYKPELLTAKPKDAKHRAKDDILESIAEMRHYLTNFLHINV